MALELFGGAALGTAFSELTKAVVNFSNKAIKFKSILHQYKSTLTLIEPVVREIEKWDRELDLPEEETKIFTDQLKEAADLVSKCSKTKLLKRASSSTKLKESDASLVKFFQTYAQVLQTRDNKRIQVKLNEICAKLDEMSKYGGGQVVCGQKMFVGLCGAPGVPVFTVGLDVPLHELKMRLLKDGLQVVVLSAPGGCGKTTLAKMLCHDVQIQGIFTGNIFFVTVSKTPTLRIIVQNMFLHKSYRVPEFQNDEDMMNQLENWLRKDIGPDPVLLVLDDVWSESESLIHKFMFQIPGYKILVTSRCEFPGFNSTYKLELLSDEDAMALFRHSAFPQDGSMNMPKDLVHKIVSGCKGFPLALKVVGASLCRQPVVIWRSRLKQWSKRKLIVDSNRDLFIRLKTSIDALDEKTNVKECFLDLGSFPEDQRIPAMALMDMWVELYNLDEDDALANIHQLSTRNLVNLVLTRNDASEVDKDASEVDGNEHFVTQHDLLRELAIDQSSPEPVEQRKRLILDIRGNDLPKWSIEQMQQPFHARLLSISTDETFSSSWCHIQLPEIEVLILNFQTRS